MDVDAVREYIKQGHTVEEAAAHFDQSARTIRNRIGPVKAIRKCLGTGRKVMFVKQRSLRFEEAQWAYVMENGGTPFLRSLIAAHAQWAQKQNLTTARTVARLLTNH